MNFITSTDLAVLDWIRNTIRNPFFDKIMPYITLLAEKGIFFIAVAVVMLFFKSTRKTGLKLGAALLLGLIIGNGILKNAVGRIRPYDLKAQMGETIDLIIKKQHDFSFPSGHTLAAFEAAGVFMICDRKRFGWVSLVLAFLIGFSRLYLYVHYPSDVLAGAVLGVIFAVLGCLIVDAVYRLIKKKSEEKAA